MNRSLNDILTRFPRQRILVVGDVMLDEYLWGSVCRISPEAPVPVVELHKRSQVPGGAANTAANVAGLQAQVHLVGVRGQDEAGQHLCRRLAAQGIHLDGLLVEANRPTTTKTRIIAHSQQVVRIDHEQRGALPVALQERLLDAIEDHLPQVDGCILSDYAKGVVFPGLARRLIQRAMALGKPVVVDPKGTDFAKYCGATLVKPNLHEAGLFLKQDLARPTDVLKAGRRLLAMLGVEGVLITCGAAGMSLFEQGKAPVSIPAQAREVYDVTGAGDTVGSVLAVALTAGASLEQSAQLASRAAGIIVRRVGTTAVKLDELRAKSPEWYPSEAMTLAALRD